LAADELGCPVPDVIEPRKEFLECRFDGRISGLKTNAE